MNIRIDENVPMPLTKQDVLDSYPIAKLEPGQSFFVPADTKLADKIASTARQFGAAQKPARTYVVERRDEDIGEGAPAEPRTTGGLRIWRKT